MYSRAGTIDDEYIRYILETYSAMIIRLCYTYTKNKDDAEDMAQEVFVELMRRDEPFADKNHEKAWLLRTAVNKCKNLLKSSWFKRTVPLEDEYTEYDNGLDKAEGDNTVMQAVLKLPDKYRTVIHLHYFNDLSIKEISAVTGKNSATVGTQLARGRELLKNLLKGDIDL